MPTQKINAKSFSLRRFFQEFKEGDFVAVSPQASVPFNYSNRIKGKTGRVLAKRGSAYYIEVKELNKPKRYLLRPIHLKKIEVAKK
ncbi:MAG: hypothetical protein Q8Q31_03045 [Nanoarchaeota archaeon]|nr:hypothetical protein [Nanoarchaeota archaeon]